MCVPTFGVEMSVTPWDLGINNNFCCGPLWGSSATPWFPVVFSAHLSFARFSKASTPGTLYHQLYSDHYFLFPDYILHCSLTGWSLEMGWGPPLFVQMTSLQSEDVVHTDHCYEYRLTCAVSIYSRATCTVSSLVPYPVEQRCCAMICWVA